MIVTYVNLFSEIYITKVDFKYALVARSYKYEVILQRGFETKKDARDWLQAKVDWITESQVRKLKGGN